MRESASRGFYLSSRPPYGYRKIRVKDGIKEHTKLEPYPDQSYLIKEIFESVLNGKGLIEIVRELNRRIISGPRGGKWGKTGVYTILTNEIYTGTFVWGKSSKRGLPPVRTENTCPPLVDRDAFLRVQTLMKDRMPEKVHPRRPSSSFLLSGIVFCGHCGKALTGRYAKNGRYAYYSCGTLDKQGRGSCPSRYLNRDKFESIVIAQIKKRILTKKNLLQLVDMVNEEIDGTMNSHRDELDSISHSINDINYRLERLYDAIETGKVELGDIVVRIRDLRACQEQHQTRRIEIENEMSDRRVEFADLEHITGYVDDLKKVLDSGLISERKSFIRSFVKEVKVADNEVVLSYTMPLVSENMPMDTEEVLPIVQYGGRYWT